MRHTHEPTLQGQIHKLSQFIMHEVPGEPSESEGAVDCAIRIIETLQIRNAELLAAMKALIPEGWGDDGTMEHMPGIQQAREAIAKAAAQGK